eukprot:scaffold35009_cov24-Tisochrysis_lutea.AAC.3
MSSGKAGKRVKESGEQSHQAKRHRTGGDVDTQPPPAPSAGVSERKKETLVALAGLAQRKPPPPPPLDAREKRSADLSADTSPKVAKMDAVGDDAAAKNKLRPSSDHSVSLEAECAKEGDHSLTHSVATSSAGKEKKEQPVPATGALAQKLPQPRARRHEPRKGPFRPQSCSKSASRSSRSSQSSSSANSRSRSRSRSGSSTGSSS